MVAWFSPEAFPFFISVTRYLFSSEVTVFAQVAAHHISSHPYPPSLPIFFSFSVCPARLRGRENKDEGRGGESSSGMVLVLPQSQPPVFAGLRSLFIQEIPGSRRWLEILRVIPMPMAVRPPLHTYRHTAHVFFPLNRSVFSTVGIRNLSVTTSSLITAVGNRHSRHSPRSLITITGHCHRLQSPQFEITTVGSRHRRYRHRGESPRR